jgi:putative ABC transport system permease protein
MKLRLYFVLAWRNIWRNKRRSYIMMSSIAFAVMLSCLMMSVQYGTLEHMIENAVKFYSGHIQLHHEKYWNEKVVDHSFSLDQSLLHCVESLPNVQLAVPRIESFALSAFQSKTKGALVLGIDPEREDGIINVRQKLVDGQYFDDVDKSVLVGEGLADYLGLHIEDSLVLISQGYHGASAVGLYPVAGIVKFPNPSQNDQIVCMTINEAQWFYGLEGRVLSLALLMKPGGNIEMTKDSIRQLANGKKIKPMDWNEMMPELQQTVNMKVENGKIMIMVLYIVIGFGMFGTFLMMTAERSYEFGTAIAIGMKRWWLQASVFLELAMMSIMGVVAGLVMSLGVIVYLYFNPIRLGSKMTAMYESYGIEPVVEFALRADIFFYQAWAVLIIGLFLSFYPIMVLRKIKPVEAMRNT